ncbi:hypothetical protein KIN20_013497 [Parelaphostrongylus tenuis]|uniref:Uncharacterized protein n=1 Tax=Parelaphostrongylus tenuis TaxID=148309 RepID=A0AAD5QR27_PARTN|nr:hypothetical protein KIN20_013497 [Parelaphostrongylus tenuis]
MLVKVLFGQQSNAFLIHIAAVVPIRWSAAGHCRDVGVRSNTKFTQCQEDSLN